MFKLRNKDLSIFITGSSGLFGKSLQKYLTKKKSNLKLLIEIKKKNITRNFSIIYLKKIISLM